MNKRVGHHCPECDAVNDEIQKCRICGKNVGMIDDICDDCKLGVDMNEDLQRLINKKRDDKKLIIDLIDISKIRIKQLEDDGNLDDKLQHELDVHKIELASLEWYTKKHRYYEIKDELTTIITKRNLELYHIKKRWTEDKQKLIDLIESIKEIRRLSNFTFDDIDKILEENRQNG